MSTRGAFGFRIDGKDFIAYNHSDSYPSGLGVEFVAEVVALLKKHGANLAANVRRIKLVSEAAPPTAEDIAALKPFTRLDVSKQSTSDWYCLLREAQGSLTAALESGYMLDNHTFLAGSLFCEYAYILNLDSGKVEFYKGFNKDKDAAGRYAALFDKPDHRETVEYYGVALVGEFPMKRIPKDWEAKAYPSKDE